MKDDKNKKNADTENVEDEEKACGEECSCSAVGQKVEELDNKYKRALADYQNLEKRTVEERREWIKSANRELVLRLLPVLDTLNLANSHVQNEGLGLSIKHFLDVLKTESVIKIETNGREFNPENMECVGTKEGEEGKVLEELRSGYMMNDRVLRAAQVIVGEGKPEEKEKGLEKDKDL